MRPAEADLRTIFNIEHVLAAIRLPSDDERSDALVGLYLHAEPNDAACLSGIFAMALARCPEAAAYLTGWAEDIAARPINTGIPAVVSPAGA